MMSLGGVLHRLFLSIVAIPFILLLYVVVLHLLPDEALSPGAAAWLQLERVAVPKEQNSHYLILGMEAPAGVDSREYGEARVERIVTVERERPRREDENQDHYLPDGYAQEVQIERATLNNLCNPVEEYCIERYRSGADALFAQGDNALLLARYRVLRGLAHYQTIEPVGLYTPFPRLALLTDAQRLQHVAIVKRFLEGERAAALEELANDLRFSRMLMAEADTLLMRMISIRMVANVWHIYSQLLEVPDAGDVLAAIEAIPSLSDAERDFELVLAGEFRFDAQATESLETQLLEIEGGPVKKLFLSLIPVRKNRMLNRLYLYLNDLASHDALSPSQIAARNSEGADRRFLESGVWDYLVDPVTSIVMLFTVPNYSPYLLRHRALDGLLRVLKLKAAIRAMNVPAAGLDAFIIASPFASAYPDEVAPIRWDAGANALSYTAVGEGSSRYLSRVYFHLN